MLSSKSSRRSRCCGGFLKIDELQTDVKEGNSGRTATSSGQRLRVLW